MGFIDTIPECTILILLKWIRPCRFDQELSFLSTHTRIYTHEKTKNFIFGLLWLRLMILSQWCDYYNYNICNNVCWMTPQCLRLKTCIFAVPSFFLDSEIKTTKLFIYTFFNYGLCLGLFFNRKEKTFSRQNHSHFYRALNVASFSDERFNLNRVRNLWKRRITKSSINGRFLRRRSKLFGLLEFYPSVRML